MALLKTIYTEDNTGCAATYWKICDVEADWIKKHGKIELMGYISEQAFNSSKNPVIIKTYEIRNDIFDTYFSEQILNQENVTMLSQAYEYVKAYSNGEFLDAIDA
jgi:hypothetical protein